MSGTQIASPPNTIDVTQRLLATMAALTGTITDLNPGSQIRTIAEAFGSVIDMQGVATAQATLKALAYGSASAYGITAYPAQQASGSVVFSTSSTGNPPPASQSVGIPANTIVATIGGVQYLTVGDATLAQGQSSVTVPIVASAGGTTGNAPAGAVTRLLTNVGYPLFVSNAAPIAGGAVAEAPAVTLARLAAKQAALGRNSPVAVANACIGVVGADNSICQYAECYEPWIAANGGPGANTAGFTVYVDNGSGGASAALLAACVNALNGNSVTNTPGNRPAGVPYTVVSVVPINAAVTVTGVLSKTAPANQIESAITAAVQAYFAARPFNASAEQSGIYAAVADVAFGYFTSLNVTLGVTGSGTTTSVIPSTPQNRILLTNLNVTVTVATS